MTADELCRTDSERACLGTLRAASGGDPAMERHCVRQLAIAERLAGPRTVDRELLSCAAWLHDAGLWTDSAEPYVTEGALLARRTLAPWHWPQERLQRLMDACEQHHAPTSRASMGLEVELIRQSDLVDVTRGLVRFGLDRGWLAGLFAEVPRDGIYRMLARAVGGELRRRPRTITEVFVAPRRTGAA
jgi:hypothetical protein